MLESMMRELPAALQTNMLYIPLCHNLHQTHLSAMLVCLSGSSNMLLQCVGMMCTCNLPDDRCLVLYADFRVCETLTLNSKPIFVPVQSF